jgi:tetratricopeptide (TPR) repeat protein
LKSLVILVLGALPLHCIGNPLSEHNMDGMPHAAGALTPAVLGSVSFQISCKSQVKEEFNRAVALLHSFWLDEAERTFKAVAIRDPDCAMADWGVAMTNFNQVNGGPTSVGVAAANKALAKADVAHEKDPMETAYIQALHSFFDGYAESDFQTHAERYAVAMSQVAAAYPNDLEAQVFHALALINSEPRDDVVLANKKKAVAILYPPFRVHPNHPGIAHYIIHACDNPGMAQQGIEAAVRYAAIAPAAPHALHMPSHVFMRLGLWQDDIRSNLASKAASENPEMHVGAEARLHAMEFLEYAYLQSGQIAEAAAIVAEAKMVRGSDVDPRFPNYYSIVEALYPVLFAIETQDWVTASKLKLEGPNWFTQAQALLAHAVAAGHLHDAEGGKAAGEALEASVAPYPILKAGSSNATLPDEIRAWARFAQGDLPGAILLLQPVADRQDKLGEGGIEVPAREMLADMLFLNGQIAEALHEYQGVLASDPNRFNALLGAGRAAEGLSERDVAANYYRILLANCAGANGKALEALRHARSVVDEMAIRPASVNEASTSPNIRIETRYIRKSIDFPMLITAAATDDMQAVKRGL